MNEVSARAKETEGEGKTARKGLPIHTFHHHQSQPRTWRPQQEDHDSATQSAPRFSGSTSDATHTEAHDRTTPPVDQQANEYSDLGRQRGAKIPLIASLPVPADAVNL